MVTIINAITVIIEYDYSAEKRSKTTKAKAKAKASNSYIARLTGTKPDQPRFTIIGSGSWSARANGAAALMRPSTERANEQLDPSNNEKKYASRFKTVSRRNPFISHTPYYRLS